MPQKHNSPEEVINAFHMMWDTFPEHARLIHKDRTVLAVNKAAEEIGMTVGTPCYAFAPNRSHSICLANQALKENVGKYRVAAAGFALRRKTMTNGLCAAFHMERAEAVELMQRAGLDERVRCEKLTFQELARLSDVYTDWRLNK